MIFHVATHVAIVIVLPPLLLGVIAKTKALFAGRRGPPLFQAYFDIFKLLQKGSVFSTTTTWVFRFGPIAGVAAPLLASLLLPLGGYAAPISFAGDLLLFAYLFGLARFFVVCAALDTGSAFEGMGAAREATFSALAEPAMFFAMLVLVKRSSSLALTTMLGSNLWPGAGAPLVLVVVALFIVLLAENSRIPFDDPNTHLELTMVHEVMVLDHGGPALGMILYGASLKLFIFGAIIVRLILPVPSWPVFLLGMIGLAIAIGIVESVMARLRMRQIPSLLVAACMLSAFGIVLLAR